MIPIPNTAVAMPQNKIPTAVSPDNADLFTVPPWRVERPPIRGTQKKNDRDDCFATAERIIHCKQLDGALDSFAVQIHV
jgi:hypothetical protein